MKRTICLIISMTIFALTVQSQGKVFGVKGGLTIGTQQWNNFERDPLLGFHGDVYIESLSEENAFSVFASLGYHQRGSSIQFNQGAFYDYTTGQWETINRRAQRFVFNNISLSLGAKQKFDMNGTDNRFYYHFGLRGEYTIGTNLNEFNNDDGTNNIFFPSDAFVNEFLFGVNLGGGIEFMWSELVGGFIEISAMPDFTRQYFRPPVNNVLSPWNINQRINLQEESITNISLEISVGFRFLHKIEYYEDEEDDMW